VKNDELERIWQEAFAAYLKVLSCYPLLRPHKFLGIWVRRGRGYIGSCWGNRREGDHWGDLGVDRWIILGWISRRWDVRIWTGLSWSRIETGGGRL